MDAKDFKLGYGTYGVPELTPAEALPRIADIGYEGVEICVGERYPTTPHKLNDDYRKQLRDLIGELGFELTGLMMVTNPIEADHDKHDEAKDYLRDCAQLATDLAPDNPPCLITTIGGNVEHWEEKKEWIGERIAEWGDICKSTGTRLVVEAHFGSILNTPEKTVWLLERINEPHVGTNFDFSHFEGIGCDLEETVAALAPFTIHTHVKDVRPENGGVRYLLPGEGTTDYVQYYKAMARAGAFGFITLEITAMIFNVEGYDPWYSAEYSFNSLNVALEQARPF